MVSLTSDLGEGGRGGQSWGKGKGDAELAVHAFGEGMSGKFVYSRKEVVYLGQFVMFQAMRNGHS